MIKKRLRSVFLTLVIIGLGQTHLVQASPNCSVEPFNVWVNQGSRASVEVRWTADSMFNLYEVSLGNLPLSVEAGFPKFEVSTSAGISKSSPLIIQANSDAQVGSFMISIVYKYLDENKEQKESVCQFNLSVNKKASSYQQPSISIDVSKTVSNGALPPIVISKPASTTMSMGQILSRMSRGYKGEQVKSLQDLLKKLGFFPEAEESTGYFGPITESAVKLFQKSRNIEQVGIVGPLTRKALSEVQ